MTVLSMKDSFNLWQNGCISLLPEKVVEISTVTLLLKGLGASLCVYAHRDVGFTLVQTHQTCKLRKVNESLLKQGFPCGMNFILLHLIHWRV